MTSLPPKRWGFSNAPAASGSPDRRSRSWRTTVVVPTSSATPSRRSRARSTSSPFQRTRPPSTVIAGSTSRAGPGGRHEDLEAAPEDDELEVRVRRLALHDGAAGEPVARPQERLLLVGRAQGVLAAEDLDDALVAAARAPAGRRDDHRELVGRVEQRPARDERDAATAVDEVAGHDPQDTARGIACDGAHRHQPGGRTALGDAAAGAGAARRSRACRRSAGTMGLDRRRRKRQITVRERLPSRTRPPRSSRRRHAADDR